jgi:hypothetical protein
MASRVSLAVVVLNLHEFSWTENRESRMLQHKPPRGARSRLSLAKNQPLSFLFSTFLFTFLFSSLALFFFSYFRLSLSSLSQQVL